MTPDEYAPARENHRRFLVQPGHEISDLERVLERRDRFTVVQKPGRSRVAEDGRA